MSRSGSTRPRRHANLEGMNFRSVSVFAAFLLVLGLAYAAYWNSAASALRTRIEAWAEARRADGGQVAYQSFYVRGFPLELRAEAKQVRLELADGTTAQAPLLTASALPWAPLTISIELAEGASAGVAGAGARPALDLAAKSGKGTLSLGRDGRVYGFALSIHEFAGGLAGAAPWIAAERAAAEGTWPPTPPAGHEDTALTVQVETSGLNLPGEPPAPLPALVDRLVVALRVQGRLPAEANVAALRQWSGDGGTVELDRFDVKWGPVATSGNATFALDPGLQPQAAGSVSLSGLDTVIEALVKAGKVKPNQGALARAAMGLIAKPGPDGKPQVSAPITLQNHKLSLGPLTVATVPEIQWEDQPASNEPLPAPAVPGPENTEPLSAPSEAPAAPTPAR